MADEETVATVRRYLRALAEAGIEAPRGVIFGSQAQGRADSQSDIDLLVISPRFDGPRKRQDVSTLWRVAAATDNRIEPIPCGERQYETDDGSTIIEVARREGRVVER
jgi:predicted nucleotidyltransferase